MTVHGLRPEFQPSNFATNAAAQETKAPEVIKATAGEHEGIPSVNTNTKTLEITGLGQSVDIHV